jgi:hypothetical protein
MTAYKNPSPKTNHPIQTLIPNPTPYTMKQPELLEHINTYAATGHIDDALIPFYDQKGRWRGDSIKWQMPVSDSDLKMIQESHLDESRRIFQTDDGPVLLTSFYWHSSNAVTLTHIEIKGSVMITQNAFVHAAILRRVGGHFIANAKTDRRIYLPSLQSVGGDFSVMRGFQLLAPRLGEVGGNLMVAGYIPPALMSVGGRLNVYNISKLEAEKLEFVGGCLTASKAEIVKFPLLTTIGGSCLMDAAWIFHAPLLESIGGDFLAFNVTNIWVRRLRQIGGDMDTRSAKGFYHPAIKFGGNWMICSGAVDTWVAAEQAKEILRSRSEPTPYL